MRADLASALRGFLEAGVPAVRVAVVRIAGSAPREAGATMFVTAAASLGTIGGGLVEQDAVRRARALLQTGDGAAAWSVALNPDTGQCCGGRMWLRADLADHGMLAELEAAERDRPTVLLFGAGHVGRAIARALAPLDLRVRWIDEREHEFDHALAREVESVPGGSWAREIAAAPEGSACVVMTHSHSLDALITACALERETFCYVGLIGSRTKRLRFERAFRDDGLAEAAIARLTCPIGNRSIRDKRPEVIALFTAAEILEAVLRHRNEAASAGGADRAGRRSNPSHGQPRPDRSSYVSGRSRTGRSVGTATPRG